MSLCSVSQKKNKMNERSTYKKHQLTKIVERRKLNGQKFALNFSRPCHEKTSLAVIALRHCSHRLKIFVRFR